MILEFDGRGDILSRFPPVEVEFTVNFESGEIGAGEYTQVEESFEIVIDDINIIDSENNVIVRDDVADEMKAWFVKDGDEDRSIYQEIYNRCLADVNQRYDYYREDE